MVDEKLFQRSKFQGMQAAKGNVSTLIINAKLCHSVNLERGIHLLHTYYMPCNVLGIYRHHTSFKPYNSMKYTFPS